MCAPAHVLMSLYPIDKSFVCLQEGRHVRIYVLPISTTYEGTYSDDFVTVFYTLVLYIRFTLSRLVTDCRFSLGTPVSSSNKTDRHDITEILYNKLYLKSEKIKHYNTSSNEFLNPT